MNNNQKTILLVEDDAILALSEMRQLKKEGYEVLHSDSGENSIQVVRELAGAIDLILMDVDLGDGIDGTVAAQEILKEFSIPVVFLSSHTEPEIVEKTEKITSYGYVVKNTGATVLNTSIKMAFKLFQAHKDLEKHKSEIEKTNQELEQANKELAEANLIQIKIEEELVRANRVYAVISQINQMIVRERDKDKILKESCRIAVEYGKFRMAWIGFVNENTKIIQPITWYGHEDGYLTIMVKISTEDIPAGRGTTGIGVREGKVFYCNDIGNDPRMIPWRKEALKREYRSSIALPIFVQGQVIGAFTLYISEAFFFGESEIRLLEQVTNDIGYALEMVEVDLKRRRAEADLQDLIIQKETLMKELEGKRGK
ncbi:MAG: GAF domain-containing protein [Leptospiraceae bacterium]|nr:GAF domain-containing protein [Leptospiraceae bacterium]